MNKRSKRVVVAFCVCLLTILTIYIAYSAYQTWSGSMSWTVEEFTVWDSATGGTEITSPYANSLGSVSSGEQSFDFYIENEADVAITVDVQSEVPSGCTASWSSAGSYSISVGTTRVLATLTLTISGSGSYSWEFAVV